MNFRERLNIMYKEKTAGRYIKDKETWEIFKKNLLNAVKKENNKKKLEFVNDVIKRLTREYVNNEDFEGLEKDVKRTLSRSGFQKKGLEVIPKKT